MQIDPNTTPHPCEAQPLEPMPSEHRPTPNAAYSDWEWNHTLKRWELRDDVFARCARLRAALHAKDAECETMKSLIAEHLANDARRICEIRNLRAEVERLKADRNTLLALGAMLPETFYAERDTVYRYGLVLRQWRALLEAQGDPDQTASGWRDAGEVPENDEDVMLWVEVEGGAAKPHARIGAFSDGGWCVDGLSAVSGVTVTHWQPLPDPPKEADDA